MTQSPEDARDPSRPAGAEPPAGAPPGSEQGGAHGAPPPYGTSSPGSPPYGTPSSYGSPPYGTPSSYGSPPPYGSPPVGPAPRIDPAEERTWGMLAHLSGLLAAWIALGFLGPLIVLLVKGNASAFVRRHATEAVNFQLTLLVATVAAGVLSVLTLGIALVLVVPLGAVIAVIALVLVIRAAIAANNGKDYRYPLTWRILS